MTETRSKQSLPWQPALLALVSVALVVWFLRGVNMHELGETLRRADKRLIAAGISSVLLTYVFRAWRWQQLLAPIGGASFRNSFRITVMGFTATNLLPGRLGEVLRPYLIGRVEPVNVGAALATVVIERVLDVASVMLLFGVFLLRTTVDVGPSVKWAGGVAAASAAVGLVVMVFGAGRPETLRRWSDALTGLLPARVAKPAAAFGHTVVDGLRVMRQPAAVLKAGAFSLLLWLSIALTIWSASLAVGLTLSFTSTFLIVMYLVVGVAVPVPAGVGSYHFMFQLAATGVFGAPREQATAAAILAHAISFLPISVLGLVYLAQDGWTLARLRSVRPDGGQP